MIAVTNGLKGMGDALAVAYPATTLQTCLVHLIRNSLDLAGGPQDTSARAPGDLHRRLGRRGRGRARRLCERSVGAAVPYNCENVAPSMGPGHSVFCVPAGSPSRDLHDERARKCARAHPENHQDTWPLSDR